ncbi:MAG: hypothetical protein HKP17_06295 [Ignavibacteriaceae bacterium]|nr:hypothetical protein [Ignavibacteriaceae bacterium]
MNFLRHIVFRISYILFILFSAEISIAQQVSDTLKHSFTYLPANRIFSNFDKQLNTYFLNTGFDFGSSHSKFQYKVNQNFRSTLVKSNTNSIRDEQYLNLMGKYTFNSFWNLGMSASSSILSDDRQLAINQATINQGVIFSEFNLNDEFFVLPYGGFSDNRQVGENDFGPVYGFEALGRNLDFTNFRVNSSLKFENEDISPRKNLIRFFDLAVTNPFNPEVSNFIETRFTQSRKDFYFPADSIISSNFNVNNNIEGRTETVFLLQDRLTYNRLLDVFAMELAGRINLRNIDRDTRYRSLEDQSPSVFDTQVDEFIIGLESSFYYDSEFADAILRLNYFERDEKHITKRFEGSDENFFEQRSELESSKNNNSSRATISLSGNINVSRTDRFSLSLFHSKLKYDTPSPENDDDRDELLTILRLRYSKYLTPFFQAYLNVEGTLSHAVYLFASRSANNNINRVLRLAMGGHYTGTKFSSLNNFEVSANYTVYDFEDIASNLRSISFRQFTATDSTQYKFNRTFSFILTAYVKLTDQGELDWNDFAERPKRYLQEIFGNPKIGLNFNNAFFAVGFRYFSLKTFNYKERDRIPDTRFLSIGPLFEILIGSNSLYLKLNSWYEFISVNEGADSERLNLILAMNWKF